MIKSDQAGVIEAMKVILSLMLALIPAAVPQDFSVPIKDLRNAPAEVVLDNRSLHLTAYPWRDFTPGAWGRDGSPMMVVLRISAADKKALPKGVRIDRAWVLFGEETWEASELRGRQDRGNDSWKNCPNSPMCEATIRGGPKWVPDIYVDVVVRGLRPRLYADACLQAVVALLRSSHLLR